MTLPTPETHAATMAEAERLQQATREAAETSERLQRINDLADDIAAEMQEAAEANCRRLTGKPNL